MDKSQTATYCNTSSEPGTVDIGEMVKALSFFEKQPDTVKKIAMSSSAINEVIEPDCVYKSMPTGMAVPKDWALLTFQSGKKVLLHLTDGATVEIPDPLKVTFEFPEGVRYQYGKI